MPPTSSWTGPCSSKSSSKASQKVNASKESASTPSAFKITDRALHDGESPPPGAGPVSLDAALPASTLYSSNASRRCSDRIVLLANRSAMVPARLNVALASSEKGKALSSSLRLSPTFAVAPATAASSLATAVGKAPVATLMADALTFFGRILNFVKVLSARSGLLTTPRVIIALPSSDRPRALDSDCATMIDPMHSLERRSITIDMPPLEVGLPLAALAEDDDAK
mmetsp:Transcript_34693/g.75925  ORF Transcript_34693/g.75925 Transcript_34693/m.75925 type:complete len:226 (-) Transcript_34693:626-1303(-)